MDTQLEIAILIVVVVAGFALVGTVLSRIVRTQEAILRRLDETPGAAEVPPSLGPTVIRKPSSFDAMRRELEERRRIAAEQEDE